jgi:2,4-dienoyl-CoA reductase-like NADH-dependent reductase (Old Yellow Enzyme family)
MMDATSYPSVLSPLTLGPARLRNRVAHVAMSTDSTHDGRVSRALIQYHVNRARGGVAMTISEPIGMVPRHGSLPRTQAWNDADADGFKRWADEVGQEGALLLGQVQDAGRGRHAEGRTSDAIGASVLPDDLSWTVPRAMGVDEIRAYVDDVAASARRLQGWGFAGVEMSCGHGHLFHQFLSPWMNRRDDAYGGDIVGRVRFVSEMVAAVRAACGSGFLIGLKLPADDGLPGSIDAGEAFSIAEALARQADFVSFAFGAHARTLEMHVPDRFGPRLAFMDRLRALRPALGAVPLVAIGRITDPAEAEAILQAGEAEMIGLGRALVADPAFLRKATSNRAHDIRYCLSCNTCWGTIVQARKTIACVNNPRVTMPDETDFWPAPAVRPRRVAVVGAGVAGLEAAWVAAARGHAVTVFGRGDAVGGATLTRAALPGGETITSIADYQYPQAIRAGAQFVLGREVGVAEVLATRPDAVVLATGSRMIPPDWLPPDMADVVPDLRTAMAGLSAIRSRQPGTAVIYDMDHSEGVYAAALHVAVLFERVVIVTPRDTIGQELHLMVRQGMLRRVAQAGIRLLPYCEPVWTEAAMEGALSVANVHTGVREAIGDVAFLAYATPRAPLVDLEAPLRAAGVEVLVVGDAAVAGELLAATASGHAAGMRV